MAVEFHLAEDPLALHLLLQHLEGLIDIVVTDENLHAAFLFDRAAGQCVQYVAPDGSIARSSCIGFNRDIGTPPAWFAALCNWIPAPQADVVRSISYRDKPYGSVVVTTERAAVAAAIWNEVSGMLGLTALEAAGSAAWLTSAWPRKLKSGPNEKLVATGQNRSISCAYASRCFILNQHASEPVATT